MTDRSLRHCVLSDVQISGVSFGEETQNIRNTNTVEVLIFNPNDPYIPSTVSVDLPHTAAETRRPADRRVRYQKQLLNTPE